MDRVGIVINAIEDDDNILNVVPVAVNLALPLPGIHLDLFEHRDNRPPRNEGYFENTIPLYNLSDFKKHFRMSSHTMEVLFLNIQRTLGARQDKIPLEKKVHFTVWMLSKPETFLAAGDRFQFARSTGHKIFCEIISAICEMINDHVVWPNAIRQQETANVFQARSQGFPGIVGVIDGSHIHIKQPPLNPNDYYNRKQVHSVILQAICDEDCRFINVSTGYPGRMHDARVFRVSGMSEQLENIDNPLITLQENHVIGDAAYPLTNKLLTPFRDTGHLTNQQTNYNVKLSSVRSTIERSFCTLKGKFRRLRCLELTNLNLISKTIIASCVIHNIIINNDGLSDDEYSDEEDLPQQNNLAEIGLLQLNNRNGENKRNTIVETLPNII